MLKSFNKIPPINVKIINKVEIVVHFVSIIAEIKKTVNLSKQ